MLFLSVSPEQSKPIPNQIDGIELRLDLATRINLELVKNLLATSLHPLMLTLRKASHGGLFQGSEEEREILIQQLLMLEPDFFDLEYDMRPNFIKKMLKNFRKTKFILSYHNFKETPADLDKIYQSMSQYSSYGYKIAALSLSTNDALRMLTFARKYPQASAICMGEKGEFARVLGPVSGNLINYASLDGKHQTSPGQLSVDDLIKIYHFPTLNPRTALYGLIGDPVNNSQGHLYHNALFEKQRLDAIYVKMCVTPEELSAFLPLAKELGFRGLSVTMPLKEKILDFIDHLDLKARKVGAVNTLLFKHGQVLGTNTDGSGALDAIEKRGSVAGKKLVLIGAGGAARAIAFEAHKRGADVLILNRTVQKAQDLSYAIGCKAGGLSEIPSDYDILINCSPDPMPIDPKKIIFSALVMDIVYVPNMTSFLLKASNLGCQIVYGEEMFLNQAAAQNKFWIGHRNV
jgi:3-dehydroquinate dehydratase/shikimate dehydrogenase